jgi:opacity protein-like surface antigen
LVLASLLTFPAFKSEARAQQSNVTAVMAPLVGVLAGASFVTLCWINYPGGQGRVYFPGEFFVAGFGGANIPGNANWDMEFARGETSSSSVRYSTQVTGGFKVGYFLKSIPYLGAELETNVATANAGRQNVSLSPAVAGVSNVTLAQGHITFWTVTGRLLGRYGFLPDNEVPFGRLQPYVGVGPGGQAMWGPINTKGLRPSLEVEGGVRYILLKNLSTFVEYKYSRVFGETLGWKVVTPNFVYTRAIQKADLNLHKVVLGVALHF